MALFIPFLKNYGLLNQMQTTLCLVGSRLGDQHDPYNYQPWHLLAPNLTVIGFEPDPVACEAANVAAREKNVNWNETHFPVALWNTVGKKTIFVTADPRASSIYPPNGEFLQRFENSESFRPVSTYESQTITLDEFFRNQSVAIDFLQIDTQGGELAVLEGAIEMLSRHVLAMVVEVEWLEQYKGQPLFSDVDIFLRKHGFSLFSMTPPGGFMRRDIPVASKEHPFQLGATNAFYIRDLLRADCQAQFRTPDHLLKLACLADALNLPDYALEVLVHLTRNYGRMSQYNCADAIIESLASIPKVIQTELQDLPIFRQIHPYSPRYPKLPGAE